MTMSSAVAKPTPGKLDREDFAWRSEFHRLAVRWRASIFPTSGSSTSHLDRLDSTGVSRRDFARLVAGGVAAGLAGELMGGPITAYAAENGKIAYMYFSATLQYCRTVSKSVQDTAAALGAKSVSLDAEFNSNKEYDQFQQLQVAGDLGGIIINPPDASNIKRISEECQKNKIWMGNVWATLPWYTPFDAGDYYTYYSCPDDFNAAKKSPLSC